MVIKVAITGSIGSGKTYFAKILESYGLPVIYADNIAKDLIIHDNNINLAVKNYFNSLDFKKIKLKIFNNFKKKIWLERLIHPKVILFINNIINKYNNNYIFIELPLVLNLFSILEKLAIDEIIVINCNKKLQISRIMQRDHLSKTRIISMINQQISYNKIAKIADYLFNGDNLESLEEQASKLCSLLVNTKNCRGGKRPL